MHFCPRPDCLRWYHAACLSSRDRTPSDTHAYLLALPPSAPSSSSSPKKTKKEAAAAASYAPDRLAKVPVALLSLVARPITRGSPGSGIVGNAEQTLRAREVLKVFCEGKEEGVAKGWRTQCGVEELEDEDAEEELVGERGVGASAGSSAAGKKRGGKKAETVVVEDLGEDGEEGVLVCKGCEGLI